MRARAHAQVTSSWSEQRRDSIEAQRKVRREALSSEAEAELVAKLRREVETREAIKERETRTDSFRRRP